MEAVLRQDCLIFNGSTSDLMQHLINLVKHELVIINLVKPKLSHLVAA
jgi:hypothetical protein